MKNIFLLIISVTLLLSCNETCEEIIPDRLNQLNHNTVRLEKIFSSKPENSSAQMHQSLMNHPQLYSTWYSMMINAGDLNNPNSLDSAEFKLQAFSRDSIIQYILFNIDSVFKNFTDFEEKIYNGIERYNYLFNEINEIKIGTFYSNFNATVIDADDRIWIGLDMYLGPENEITKNLPPSIPQFYKNKMDAKFMATDVLFGYLMTNKFHLIGEDMISRMLSYGKMAYLLEILAPNENMANRFRYNESELNWCEENEYYIWKHLIDQQLIYSKDQVKINSFFIDGPFTKSLGPESPSNIGIWIGYKMIKDYAQTNCKNIHEILEENNVQTLLSTYDPK